MKLPRIAKVDGSRIRSQRAAVGMSQVQLASAADVGLSTVQRAERSDPTLGLGAATRIAQALGLQPIDIYDDGLDTDAMTTPYSELVKRIDLHHRDLEAHLAAVEAKIERLLKECGGLHPHMDIDE